ncbi:MAG: hypothetical protein F6K15_32285 [Okeania sp. SIO2B3]|nr:hypothetical protein [Okeania sp. SIO2B3]
MGGWGDCVIWWWCDREKDIITENYQNLINNHEDLEVYQIAFNILLI